jgi:hypothetical protein
MTFHLGLMDLVQLIFGQDPAPYEVKLLYSVVLKKLLEITVLDDPFQNELKTAIKIGAGFSFLSSECRGQVAKELTQILNSEHAEWERALVAHCKYVSYKLVFVPPSGLRAKQEHLSFAYR